MMCKLGSEAAAAESEWSTKVVMEEEEGDILEAASHQFPVL